MRLKSALVGAGISLFSLLAPLKTARAQATQDSVRALNPVTVIGHAPDSVPTKKTPAPLSHNSSSVELSHNDNSVSTFIPNTQSSIYLDAPGASQFYLDGVKVVFLAEPHYSLVPAVPGNNICVSRGRADTRTTSLDLAVLLHTCAEQGVRINLQPMQSAVSAGRSTKTFSRGLSVQRQRGPGLLPSDLRDDASMLGKATWLHGFAGIQIGSWRFFGQAQGMEHKANLGVQYGFAQYNSATQHFVTMARAETPLLGSTFRITASTQQGQTRLFTQETDTSETYMRRQHIGLTNIETMLEHGSRYVGIAAYRLQRSGSDTPQKDFLAFQALAGNMYALPGILGGILLRANGKIDVTPQSVEPSAYLSLMHEFGRVVATLSATTTFDGRDPETIRDDGGRVAVRSTTIGARNNSLIGSLEWNIGRFTLLANAEAHNAQTPQYGDSSRIKGNNYHFGWRYTSQNATVALLYTVRDWHLYTPQTTTAVPGSAQQEIKAIVSYALGPFLAYASVVYRSNYPFPLSSETHAYNLGEQVIGSFSLNTNINSRMSINLTATNAPKLRRNLIAANERRVGDQVIVDTILLPVLVQLSLDFKLGH